ncbi:LON peptidase substrate-binding domain-containing protein [Saccharospirillum salsuginis]|uniref:ATP-dependent protease n=1 Tax=Saccharospirillum salsuginis TaxID=418750 RepID=A0A918NIA3_9GAMM|nr:LON peptidase substrate-binding domain-containing protein [Saccharospirillum salsuginis]GGX69527.1 ATP-dependent protease [Saccharospirillum salsuginis]
MSDASENEPQKSDTRVPLFPLGALLLPQATLPLQIFEPRYLMMVSRCTRENEGFVVTLAEPRGGQAQCGCYGKIIDFGQLDNGLLGITVEGLSRVRVTDPERDATGLWWGRIETLPESTSNRQEEQACLLRYQPLLDALMEHPYLSSQASDTLDSPRGGIHQLMVWLPLDTDIKEALLAEDDFLSRCRTLDQVLNDMAGAD